MVCNNQHAVASAFGLEIILRELGSQSVFQIAGRPAHATVLDFNRHLAGCRGGGDNYVRLVSRSNFRFTESLEAAMGAGVDLFDEPVLDFIFVFCALQQWARCNVIAGQALRDVAKDTHDDVQQIRARFHGGGEFPMKFESFVGGPCGTFGVPLGFPTGKFAEAMRTQRKDRVSREPVHCLIGVRAWAIQEG